MRNLHVLLCVISNGDLDRFQVIAASLIDCSAKFTGYSVKTF